MERIERKWRDDLPPGPWNDEPDKVQWPDPKTGLACMILRNRMGVWCGYVGVDQSHPWFGKDYGDVEADVHGGLTFSGLCDGDEERGICHVPGPGEPDPLFWFGFDCGHAWDLAPRFQAEDMKDYRHMTFPDQWYKDVAFVTAETEHLAQQVAAAS